MKYSLLKLVQACCTTSLECIDIKIKFGVCNPLDFLAKCTSRFTRKSRKTSMACSGSCSPMRLDWMWRSFLSPFRVFVDHNDSKSSLTKKPTNCWGSTARFDTHPRETVVYNACYHLFWKRLLHTHTSTCVCDLTSTTNTQIAIYVMRKRCQVHLTPIIRVKTKKMSSSL